MYLGNSKKSASYKLGVPVQTGGQTGGANKRSRFAMVALDANGETYLLRTFYRSNGNEPTEFITEHLLNLQSGNTQAQPFVIAFDPNEQLIREKVYDPPRPGQDVMASGFLTKLTNKELVFMLHDFQDYLTKSPSTVDLFQRLYNFLGPLRPQRVRSVTQLKAYLGYDQPDRRGSENRMFTNFFTQNQVGEIRKQDLIRVLKEAILGPVENDVSTGGIIPPFLASLYSLGRDELRHFIKTAGFSENEGSRMARYYKKTRSRKTDQYRKKYIINTVYDHLYYLKNGGYLLGTYKRRYGRNDYREEPITVADTDRRNGQPYTNPINNTGIASVRNFLYQYQVYINNLNIMDEVESLQMNDDNNMLDSFGQQTLANLNLLINKLDLENCYDYLLVEYTDTDQTNLQEIGQQPFQTTFMTDLILSVEQRQASGEIASMTGYAGRPRDVAAKLHRKLLGLVKKRDKIIRRIETGQQREGDPPPENIFAEARQGIWFIVTLVRLDPRNVYLMPRLTMAGLKRTIDEMNLQRNQKVDYAFPHNELRIIYNQGKDPADCWFRYLVKYEGGKTEVVSYRFGNEQRGRNDCARYRVGVNSPQLQERLRELYGREILQFFDTIKEYYPIDATEQETQQLLTDLSQAQIPISLLRTTKCVPKALRGQRIAPEDRDENNRNVLRRTNTGQALPYLQPGGPQVNRINEITAWVNRFYPGVGTDQAADLPDQIGTMRIGTNQLEQMRVRAAPPAPPAPPASAPPPPPPLGLGAATASGAPGAPFGLGAATAPGAPGLAAPGVPVPERMLTPPPLPGTGGVGGVGGLSGLGGKGGMLNEEEYSKDPTFFPEVFETAKILKKLQPQGGFMNPKIKQILGRGESSQAGGAKKLNVLNLCGGFDWEV
jgi:hypothetical protein